MINTQNHLNSIENLFDAVRRAKEKVYLIVDEYDSFANRLLLEIDTTSSDLRSRRQGSHATQLWQRVENRDDDST